ncbi:hypothetical protein GCM10009801_36030 [Streptomyces albiaxialis]|uniref:Uncharacterized protein n=1 Tax=Streptomyces albiaxialis TaxID=329523 RepID=A0ABN2VZX6_9ACTN
MVFVAEKGRFRTSACSFQYSAPVTDRRVKYIAKRAAKNISSELSQMMVPTLVRFGRLTDGCACPVSTAVAVATTDIMSVAYPGLTSGGAVRCVRSPDGPCALLEWPSLGPYEPVLTVRPRE